MNCAAPNFIDLDKAEVFRDFFFNKILTIFKIQEKKYFVLDFKAKSLFANSSILVMKILIQSTFEKFNTAFVL